MIALTEMVEFIHLGGSLVYSKHSENISIANDPMTWGGSLKKLFESLKTNNFDVVFWIIFLQLKCVT